MDGTKPAPKDLANWTRTSSSASPIRLQCSSRPASPTTRTSRKPGATPPTTSSTTSSFNLDEAAFFVAGAVPDTGFSYFGHYEMYQDGGNGLEQGFGVWTGGKRQQQLLRQSRRDAHAGGRGNAGSHVLQPFPRSCVHADQYRSHQLHSRSASGRGGCRLHVRIELFQEHLCRLRQSHERPECRRQRDSAMLPPRTQRMCGPTRITGLAPTVASR